MFEFRRDEVWPGVRIKCLGTSGYQIGSVEVLRPFDGTYDGHLFAFDLSVDRCIRVLPEVVTRHYYECRVICEPEVIEEWRAKLAGATRVVVLSTDAAEAATEAYMQACPPGLQFLPENTTEGRSVRELNETLVREEALVRGTISVPSVPASA